MVAGSIRKIVINGVSYDVPADTNLSDPGSQFENAALASSGGNVRQMTKRTRSVESVVIFVNGADKARLREIADSPEDVPMSYETAEGDVYRTEGWIHMESWENEETKLTLTMHPRRRWREFLNS